jgi:hypothetical protein
MLSCIKRRQDKTTRHIRHKTQDTRHKTWYHTYRNNTQDTTHKRQHTRHEKVNIKTSRICVSCVVVLSCLVVVLGLPRPCNPCVHKKQIARSRLKRKQDRGAGNVTGARTMRMMLCCDVVLLRCAPVMRNSQCVRDWNLWTHSLCLRKEAHGSKTTWQHNTCLHGKRQQCDEEGKVAGDSGELGWVRGPGYVKGARTIRSHSVLSSWRRRWRATNACFLDLACQTVIQAKKCLVRGKTLLLSELELYNRCLWTRQQKSVPRNWWTNPKSLSWTI